MAGVWRHAGGPSAQAAKANSEYQKTMAFMETHERDQLGKKKEEGNSNQPRGEGERRKKRRVT